MTSCYSKICFMLTLVVTGLFCFVETSATENPQAGVEFFEQKIRPVLIKHCYECHSAKTKNLKGGLLLDSKKGLLQGGDSGTALVPHQPGKSLLLETLHYGEDSSQMPPKGKLPQQVIKNFERWIKMGAPDPRSHVSKPQKKTEIDFAARRQFWSFQPPRKYAAPSVKQQKWIKNKIDSFILAKLEAKKLKPAPPTSKRQLIRRATFDLIGLPPTRDEVDSFIVDDSADAFEKVIVRLLNSSHHGERWGRHWLDVARYAEDNTNMGPHNGPFHHAYRYRDWVIQAINEDVPYDKFIIRQLATDFLEETGPEDYPALGYMGLGPSYHKEVNLAKLVLENRYADDWEDRVDSLCRGLLGLTMACARCHDHKYDPLTVKDYYGIAGVFSSVRQTTRPIISPEEVAKTQPARDRAKKIELTNKTLTNKIRNAGKRSRDLDFKLKKLEASQQPVIASIPKSDGTLQTPLSNIEQTKLDIKQNKKDVAGWKKRIKENKATIAKIEKETPGFKLPLADALTEEQIRVEEISKQRMKIVYYPKPRDLNIFIRGDAGNLGAKVPRRYIEILSHGSPPQFKKGSGRLELAKLIASDSNPLTARVIVNRIWLHHFGEGIVSTPSNFGETGSRPSHAKLLDDLAVRFMKNGWSMKWLHREIMLSATYQQSSQSINSTEQQNINPNNRLLSHFNRQRLSAEAYRDALLAVSNNLDRTMAGPSGNADNPKFLRRTIYSKISRHQLSTFLQAFDFPDPAIHAAKRNKTTTPLQQLFVMNSVFVENQAVGLAAQFEKLSHEKRIDRLYQIIFARPPTENEMALGLQFLKTKQQKQKKPPVLHTSWQKYCHALLCSNEMFFID